MKNQFKAISAMLAACLFWGISFVSIKVVVPMMGPIGLAYYRFVISSVVILIMIKVGKGSIKIDPKDIPKFVLSGFLGIVAYFYFQNTGINLTTASEASIIIASIPIFSLMLETVITKKKLSPLKLILVIISFIGVFIMIGGAQNSSGNTNYKLGYLMMFGAVFSWVFYGITSKPLSEKYTQMTIVFYQGLFGAIILGCLTYFEPTYTITWSPTLIINLLYLAVLCSGITYYFYNYAISHMGVATSNLYLNLIPLIAVVTGSILLKERISMNQLLGGLLVLSAVFMVSWSDGKKDEQTVSKEIKSLS